MSFPEVMGIITGMLQFTVAGYALRLNRIFGTAQVGWSLFWAFALLALLHLIQSVTSFNIGAQLGVETEVIYSLVSLLLLTSLIHLETLLKERLRMEREEKRLRAELEIEVKKKTAYLTRAIEGLEAEMEERKRMQVDMEKAQTELLVASHHASTAETSETMARPEFAI